MTYMDTPKTGNHVRCVGTFKRDTNMLESIVVTSLQKFGFINGVDNVNWPPYRDSKS